MFKHHETKAMRRMGCVLATSAFVLHCVNAWFVLAPMRIGPMPSFRTVAAYARAIGWLAALQQLTQRLPVSPALAWSFHFGHSRFLHLRPRCCDPHSTRAWERHHGYGSCSCKPDIHCSKCASLSRLICVGVAIILQQSRSSVWKIYQVRGHCKGKETERVLLSGSWDLETASRVVATSATVVAGVQKRWRR